MPRRYPPEIRRQVVELARAGTRVKQLAATFGMSEAAVYLWLKQEQIDRGGIDGQSTDQAMELAAAKRRIAQLETELAVSRKVNEIFLDQDLAPKASTR
jgi:transposase-like protein